MGKIEKFILAFDELNDDIMTIREYVPKIYKCGHPTCSIFFFLDCITSFKLCFFLLCSIFFLKSNNVILAFSSMIWVNIMVNPFKNSRKWLNPKIYNTNEGGCLWGSFFCESQNLLFKS